MHRTGSNGTTKALKGTPIPRRLVGTCDLNPTGSTPSKKKISTLSIESKQGTELDKIIRVQSKISQQTKNKENLNSQEKKTINRCQCQDVLRCWNYLRTIINMLLTKYGKTHWK